MRTILMITGMFLLLSDTIAQSTTTAQRTEEYAVISAWQHGKKTRISVQVGSEATPDKEFEPEKGEKRFDMSPVIREMEALNAMGFELVTGNSAIMPQMTQGSGSGLPFYTFVFKRSVQ
jgi:hypothetical protein